MLPFATNIVMSLFLKKQGLLRMMRTMRIYVLFVELTFQNEMWRRDNDKSINGNCGLFNFIAMQK